MEDSRGQLGYIEANPAKRGFLDFPVVDTRFLDGIDPMPARFEMQ